MFFKNTFPSLSQYKRIFCSFFEMPFYAVIFKSSKAGTVAVNWDIARGLRDGTPNSYAKKFNSTSEAEKYIKDFNFKIVNNKDKVSESSSLGVKRKRLQSPNNSISSVKDHITKIKTAFDDLQTALPSFPGLPDTCVDQFKILNEEVFSKLRKIFNETKFKEDFNSAVPSDTRSLHGCVTFPDEEDQVSVIDGINSSQLEEAKKLFKFNEKNEIIVYTDGACSKNGYDGASAGAGIWFANDHPLNLAAKVPGIQTNNNAEIFSIIKAIELVKAVGFDKLSVHTDSDFVIKGVNEWMPRWQTNGWKTSAGAEVKNKEMFLMLYKRIQTMDSISWTYVPGHKGIIGNEEADKLARAGAKL